MSCGEPDAQEWASPVRRPGRGNGPAVTPAPRPGPTRRVTTTMEDGKAVYRAKGSSGLAARLEQRRSSLNSGGPWPSPKLAQTRVLGIQRKLHKWSIDDQDRRFSDLHNLVCDPATLMVAWHRVRANRGSRSAGVDGQTARYIEQVLGVETFLDALREELRSGSFRPRGQLRASIRRLRPAWGLLALRAILRGTEYRAGRGHEHASIWTQVAHCLQQGGCRAGDCRQRPRRA